MRSKRDMMTLYENGCAQGARLDREDDMTEGDSDAAVGRRGFLGAVAGLAAAAAVTAGAPDARAQAGSADDKKRARYQRTPHVEAFYRTARYE